MLTTVLLEDLVILRRKVAEIINGESPHIEWRYVYDPPLGS